MINRNVSLTKAMVDIFDLKGENTSEVAEYIQPVRQLCPRLDIVKSVSSTATGATNVYTCPTDKDFFLTNILVSTDSSAAADNTATIVGITIEGITVNVIRLNKLTLTSDTKSMVLNIPYPFLKLDRGSTITFSSTFTVGANTRTCTIIGFTQETSKNT